MLEQLIYKNHINEVFEFGKDGIFVNTSDLHDYEWDVKAKNNKIASLDYTISKRQLPVIIICSNEEKGLAARNKLFEVVEKDVLAMQHGKIIVGDYYFKCFVTKSEKKEYLNTKRMMKLTLTLTTEFPYWVKESTHTFGGGGGVAVLAADEEGVNLDFPFDYPFDYSSSIDTQSLNNTSFVPTNFRLIIYGACTNPAVYIAGHTYQVNCTVGENEYLTIDSTTKKIFLTGNTGTIMNKFNLRNRDSYIFEKIPAGNNVVAWSGDFGFDIILLEERSEPKWT